MWTRVTVDETNLLTRYVEIMREMDHTHRRHSIRAETAAIRSSVSRSATHLWYYQNGGFDTVLRFQFEQANDRFMVCLGFLGDVRPETVLNLVVEKSHEFMVDQGIDAVFGYRPFSVDYSPLGLLFDEVPRHPNVNQTVLDTTTDSDVLQLEYVT